MRKIFCLLHLLMLTAACKNRPRKPTRRSPDNKIYFSTITNVHTVDALGLHYSEYPNHTSDNGQYPQSGGYELLLHGGKKFKLGNNRRHTAVLSMGRPLSLIGTVLVRRKVGAV